VAIVTSQQILDYLQVNGISVPTAGQTVLTMIQPMIESAISKFLGWKVQAVTSVTEWHPRKGDRGYTQSDFFSWDVVGGLAVPRQYNRADLSIIQLAQIPVRSITSVYQNTGAWAASDANGTTPNFPLSTLLSGAEYRLDMTTSGISWTGHLIRNFGNWAANPRCVQVTYTAGLTSDELSDEYSAIKYVVLTEVADAYRDAMARANAAQQGGPIQSVSIEDFSTSIAVNKAAQDKAQFGLSQASKQLLEGYINYNKFIGR
jgi:hypothetical protein